MGLTHEDIANIIVAIQDKQKDIVLTKPEITYLESEDGVCVQVEVDGVFMLMSIDTFNEFVNKEK